MSKKVKVTLTNKCRKGIGSAGIKFSTRNDVNKIFNIPHCQIGDRSMVDIDGEPAVEYELEGRTFDRLKPMFDKMNEKDCKIKNKS